MRSSIYDLLIILKTTSSWSQRSFNPIPLTLQQYQHVYFWAVFLCFHSDPWWVDAKIINYKICKLAEIDRHEEFVAADFYMWNLNLKSDLRILYYLWVDGNWIKLWKKESKLIWIHASTPILDLTSWSWLYF